MQKRRSGCSRSTLAGENGAHSKHSIMRRRSIVWQQSTSAKRSVVTLPVFLAPVINPALIGGCTRLYLRAYSEPVARCKRD